MEEAALVDAFVYGDTPTKARAEEALEARRDLAAPVLLSALQVGDRSARARASRMFGLCAPQAVPGLTNLLTSSDSAVRYWAAYSLGLLGSRAVGAAPELAQLLKEQPTGVRKAAAGALLRMVPLPQATLVTLFSALLSREQTVARVREAIVCVLTTVEREQPGILRSTVETLPLRIRAEALRRVADFERYRFSGDAADGERWARLTTHCSSQG